LIIRSSDYGPWPNDPLFDRGTNDDWPRTPPSPSQFEAQYGFDNQARRRDFQTPRDNFGGPEDREHYDNFDHPPRYDHHTMIGKKFYISVNVIPRFYNFSKSCPKNRTNENQKVAFRLYSEEIM
jgi:hypothetical protein